MDRVYLGFDLRVADNDFLLSSQKSLTGQFLLDRKRVASGDPLVWRRPLEIDRFLNKQSDMTNPFGLSKSTVALSKFIHDPHSEIHSYDYILISCDRFYRSLLEETWGPGWFDLRFEPDETSEASWNFFGFDVLEKGGLISGLNGCGYEKEIRVYMQNRFGSAINSVGLFDTYEVAMEFATVRNTQIKDHAPFTPIGIHVKPRCRVGI